MKFNIQAGGNIETTTPLETRDIVQNSQQQWFSEMAAGVKHQRFSAQGTVAGSSIYINSLDDLGPQPGYYWSIQRVTVEGLLAADTLYVYRGQAPLSGGPSGNAVGIMSIAQNYHVGSKGLILHGGEQLQFFAAGITQANGSTVIVNGEALSVPAQQLWKLL